MQQIEQEIPNQVYHDKKRFISASGLKHFAESSLQYDSYINSEFVQSPAMAFGSAVHDRIESILKDDIRIFTDKYIYLEKAEISEFGEDVKNRGFKNKTIYKDWKKEAKGFKTDVSENVELIVNKIFSIEQLRNLLDMKTAKAEPSYFNDFIKIDGRKIDIKCKMRPDFVNLDKGFMADYKTISKVPSQKNCNYAINDFKYFIQVGFYSALFETIFDAKIFNFYFLFLQTGKPFDINVVKVEAHEIKACQYLTAQYLEKFENYLIDGASPETMFETNGLSYYSLPNYLYNI